MATAKLKGAEADYQLAVLHKRLSLIRAPFSGILGRIPNKVGSLVDPSDLLTSLSDNSKVFAYFNISETDYLDFRLHSRTAFHKLHYSLFWRMAMSFLQAERY